MCILQHVSEWDWDVNLLSCLTKLAHKAGEQRLRPAGVTQTMQAVCTDGHSDTKKAQEAKTQGGPDSTMAPRREAALARPDRGEPRQPPDVIQGKGRDITRSCTLLPPPTPVFRCTGTSASLIQTYSIITICITMEKSSPHVGGNVQMDVTYISLLCINSMRSVKRTSRFLSQKPSAS